MSFFYSTSRPVQIVPANISRALLIITNLTNSTVYVAKNNLDIESFDDQAWPIKENGVLEICNHPAGYKGPLFAMASAKSDIRILEL